MEDIDKRKFSRAHFHGKGEIILGSDRHTVTVEDLSLKGVLVGSDRDFHIKDQIRFNLSLANSDIIIETEGIIVHKNGREYGIKFTLVDAEGMIHLRSIMEYNTENYSQIESELFFLKDIS